jgi:hypothetical protein
MKLRRIWRKNHLILQPCSGKHYLTCPLHLTCINRMQNTVFIYRHLCCNLSSQNNSSSLRIQEEISKQNAFPSFEPQNRRGNDVKATHFLCNASNTGSICSSNCRLFSKFRVVSVFWSLLTATTLNCGSMQPSLEVERS